jgi:hypothetical protein
MEQSHKDYLEEHIGNYHTCQNGYIRNLDIHLLNMYEHIYRTYLDPQFVLTKWCSSCVMDCVQRLYAYYLALPQEQVQELPKKKGRPKKNENTRNNTEA